MKRTIKLTVAVALMAMLCGLAGLGPITAQSTILYVDWASGSDTGNDCLNPAAPCATIGHAIDMASEGDTILIGAGEYFENLVLEGRSLTLLGGYSVGDWGPGGGETIVNGGGVGRVFLIEGNDSVLENLTITGGQTPEDECWGGGVFLWGGHVTIRSSIIRDNRAEGGWHDEPSGSWIECGSGGGIQVGCCTGHLTLEDSVLADNYAIDLGAGISVVGVGSAVGAASADLTNVLVMNNTAGGETAMDVNEANISMQNCTVAGNHGGATPVVSAHNNREGHIVSIRNSIVWGHPGGSVECGEGSCEVSYSDIEGGWPGTGNIDADPLFWDPPNGDYRVSFGSPCIDAGTDDGAPDHDLARQPRPQDGDVDGTAITDMGAYELPRPCERSKGVDDLRGLWEFVVTGLEVEPLSFELFINDQGPDPGSRTGNDYLAVGCMASPGVDAIMPMFLRATDLCDGAYDLNLLSTAVPPEDDPFVIQFLGTLETYSRDTSDDVVGGTIRTDWFEGGEWSGTHHDRRRTKCPPVGEIPVPGLYFFGDVYAHNEYQGIDLVHRTTVLEGLTNIVSAGMRVEWPDGTVVSVPYFTDIFSPDVDFISQFRYAQGYEGDPISGEPYTFTLLDVFGNEVAGTTLTDVWTACQTYPPPRNLIAVVGADTRDIDLSWDAVPDAPGFDPDHPDDPLGFYQIQTWRMFGGERGYGANGISSLWHRIPWERGPGWPEGFPDGYDRGISLSELYNGEYELRVEAFSEPAPNSLGHRLECAVWDSAENLYFLKADDSVIFSSISGTLLDEEGNEIVNVGVRVRRRDAPGTYEVCTDPNGYYAVQGIPLGRYRVDAGRNFCGPHQYVSDDFTVQLTEEGPHVTVDFVLGLAGSIAGTVYDSVGNPLAKVPVETEDGSNGMCTLGDGSYMLTQLPLGPYRIVAGGESEWCEEQGFTQRISDEYLLDEENPDVTSVHFWLDPVS